MIARAHTHLAVEHAHIIIHTKNTQKHTKLHLPEAEGFRDALGAKPMKTLHCCARINNNAEAHRADHFIV